MPTSLTTPRRDAASRAPHAAPLSLRKTLLLSGVASSLLYLAMNAIVPMFFTGYRVADQTVSELSAIGAPTRPLWLVLAVVYDVLVVAFGYGVWAAAGRSRALRVVATALIVDGVIGLGWPPMHSRDVLATGGGTLTDTLHLVWTAVWGCLAMLAIGFGALALGRRFRVYSIVTLAILLLFGALTGMSGPAVAANLPTPLVGVWERINIGAFILWVVVLAATLLRRPRERAT